jgi:hypothetical protein
MKPYDIVELKYFDGRPKPCVVIQVTPKMIRRGTFDTSRPGLHLVRGYWHGKDPFDHRSYGKNEGFAHSKRGPVVGRVTTHADAVRLGI